MDMATHTYSITIHVRARKHRLFCSRRCVWLSSQQAAVCHSMTRHPASMHLNISQTGLTQQDFNNAAHSVAITHFAGWSMAFHLRLFSSTALSMGRASVRMAHQLRKRGIATTSKKPTCKCTVSW